MATTSQKAELIASAIQNEIQRLVLQYGYNAETLQQFSDFVTAQVNPPRSKTTKPKPPAKVKPPKKVKPLSLIELKQALFKEFGVADAKELKKSNRFQLATHRIEGINFSKKESLELLYRKLIGILPNEEKEEGYGCINGINIFNYDRPWRAFGLDPKVANVDDIKRAYRELSKTFHPDNGETGDATIFNRLTIFYKSLTEKF